MTMLLGLKPRLVDPRTLQFRAFRDPWSSLPVEYDFDAEHSTTPVPVPMFANDRYGDCVKAAQAHQTLRFELQEQGVIIPITAQEVVDQYLVETGGVDSGLVMLDAMRYWRSNGWVMGGKRYKLHSFLEVQPQDHELVKEATIVGVGLQWGLDLPLSAADDINSGQPWQLHAGPRGERRSWGGHAVHGAKYDREGPTVETWGKKQKMLWSFVDAYASECYMAVDDIDNLAGGHFNRTALADALAHL